MSWFKDDEQLDEHGNSFTLDVRGGWPQEVLLRTGIIPLDAPPAADPAGQRREG